MSTHPIGRGHERHLQHHLASLSAGVIYPYIDRPFISVGSIQDCRLLLVAAAAQEAERDDRMREGPWPWAVLFGVETVVWVQCERDRPKHV